MASISIARLPTPDTGVSQGDIFRDVKYAYLDDDSDHYVDIVEYTFPCAIVLSQSCDVCYMDAFEAGIIGTPQKFMPAIVMCPVYDRESIRGADHLTEIYEVNGRTNPKSSFFTSTDREVAGKGQHVRFHTLTVQDQSKNPLITDAVIDFKHVFTVPMKYLRSIRNDQRLCTLLPLYTSQIANELFAYTARIGLPD